MGHILKGQVRYTLAVEDVVQQGEIPSDLQGIIAQALSFTGSASATFDENIDADSLVYTVAAQKPDNGGSAGITYAISGTNASDFTINANTGAITINASPNFEATPSYSITVSANHVDFDAVTREVTLAVNNLDEIAPVIQSNAMYSGTHIVGATTPIGTVLHTAVATDTGDGTNGNVTYQVTSQYDNAFAIDANTGVVTLASQPGSGGSWSASYSMNICTITAVDDAGNVSNAQTIDFRGVSGIVIQGGTITPVAESQGTTSPFHTLNLTTGTRSDTDFFIVSDPSGLFDVAEDGASQYGGALFVASGSNLDHETATSHTITVQGVDKNYPLKKSAVTTITIPVTDVQPVITSGGSVTSIAENSGAGQTIYTATATDADPQGGTITFSLAAGSDSAISINSTTGVVTLADNPDYETQTSYSFTVVATNAQGDSASQGLTLEITNLDETAPVFTSSSSTIYLALGIDANEEVYTAVATDTGDGTNGNITYSLTDDASGFFTINSSTGVVSNVTPPGGSSGWAGGGTRQITIRATDDAGNFADRSQQFFAASAPSFGSGNAGVTVNENQAVYSPPGSGLQASHIFHYVDMTDAESGFDFKLIDSNGDEQNSTGGFNIVSDGSASLGGGLFKTTSDPEFDHETLIVHTITVRAKNKSMPFVYATTNITVTVIDKGIVFQNSTVSRTIAENSGAGQVIYQPFPRVDDPQYDTSDLTYVLSGADASHFTVTQHNANNQAMDGAVILTADPDYETKSSYAVTLTARGPVLGPGYMDTTSVNLTVTITDVAESTLLETYDLGSTNTNLFGSLYEGASFGYYYFGSINGVSGYNPAAAPSAVDLLVSSAKSTYAGAKINEIRQIIPSSGTNHNTMITVTTPGAQGLIGSSNFDWNRMDVKANGGSTVLNTLNKSSMSYSQSAGSTHYHRFSWTADTTRRFTDSDSTFATETDYDIEFYS